MNKIIVSISQIKKLNLILKNVDLKSIVFITKSAIL